MVIFRCPHPSHGSATVPLKTSKDQVLECPENHRFYRRESDGEQVVVELVTGRTHSLASMDDVSTGAPDARPSLVFMSDVPRVTGDLDFNNLSLSAAQWKILSKVDGRSTLEEVRLLAGLRADEAEDLFYSLMDAGLLEIRGRR